MEGDHKGALRYLESIYPLARMAGSLQPYTYYDYLNTLAVEMSEVGRIEEAHGASEVAVKLSFDSAGCCPQLRCALHGGGSSPSLATASASTALSLPSGWPKPLPGQEPRAGRRQLGL